MAKSKATAKAKTKTSASRKWPPQQEKADEPRTDHKRQRLQSCPDRLDRFA